ncbi:hypothetical protein [Kitasatospora sp. HPMI-4]
MHDEYDTRDRDDVEHPAREEEKAAEIALDRATANGAAELEVTA